MFKFSCMRARCCLLFATRVLRKILASTCTRSSIAVLDVAKVMTSLAGPARARRASYLAPEILSSVLVLCVWLYSIITEFYRYRMYSRAVALNRHNKTINSPSDTSCPPKKRISRYTEASQNTVSVNRVNPAPIGKGEANACIQQCMI